MKYLFESIIVIVIMTILYSLFVQTNNNENEHDKKKLNEHMTHYHNDTFSPDYIWLNRMHLLPWWNSTRYTRNSSWDIRGDIPNRFYDVGPFYRSSLI